MSSGDLLAKDFVQGLVRAETATKENTATLLKQIQATEQLKNTMYLFMDVISELADQSPTSIGEAFAIISGFLNQDEDADGDGIGGGPAIEALP